METCELPENVEIEILLRLPVKSLLRFKCICKAWYALIKSPTFITNHLHFVQALNSTHNNTCLLFLHPIDNDGFFASLLSTETLEVSTEIHFQTTGYHTQIVNSCNGIVCIADHDFDIYLLLNPATRQVNYLPPPPSVTYLSYLPPRTINLAFGFDHKINSYKVVRIVQSCNNYRYRSVPNVVQIYTLSSKTWRETEWVVPAFIFPHSVLDTYIDGAYNWVASDSEGKMILSFDMSDEVFRKMTRLPDFLLKNHRHNLTLLKGCFAIIRYPPRSTMYFEIWVMTKSSVEEESWAKQFTVGPLTGVEKPLAIWEDDKLFLESVEGELISCDLKTQKTKNLQIYGVMNRSHVVIYHESLISIDMALETNN